MADDETTPKPKCFIAMPITMRADMAGLYPDGLKHFEHVLEALLVPAAESAGYEAVRPIFSGSMSIPEGIISNLIQAEMVLCDMSVLNANVFFELGIRTAMNKPVSIVKDQHIPGAPFDNATIGYHEYDAMLGAWDIDEQVSAVAAHITSTAEKGTANALWKHYGITEVADPPQYPGDEAARDQKLDELLSRTARLEQRLEPSADNIYGRDPSRSERNERRSLSRSKHHRLLEFDRRDGGSISGGEAKRILDELMQRGVLPEGSNAVPTQKGMAVEVPNAFSAGVGLALLTDWSAENPEYTIGIDRFTSD